MRASGTPEQKERFFGIFKDMSTELSWGAYALTEPGAGSDVAGIRTSCRKDGKHWVLNGRKCFITNGARASWNVVFATVDPALGRAGHRAFVVEKGTPGFSVGQDRGQDGPPRERDGGARASRTAACPEENLLGGEERYHTKEGFMTAMKTFDNTRPLVAAMAHRHRARGVRVRARLREGELRPRAARSRATPRSPSASRASGASSRRRGW